MIVSFSPARIANRLTLDRAGDTLTINGEAFDFSGVPDGAILPRGAIQSEWIVGDVTRTGGVLHVPPIWPLIWPLIWPHGANAPEATRFPAPITMTGNEPVTLPPYDAPEEPAQ